ncbi:GNAT family N-acetyltransferase [Phaeobacter porticola]|uniref:Acetyltransferase domain-containing protein n=1 Tax=Phaeobacter porticola TaxID=1844006 RepID=A0A1L3I763_9RHOB|nr:GNAT family N-acetyltransferase [Phaeobacter porticola]APG47872.1 acetyltransferase domain-containing protein [Phaeobacter porticola]
MTGPTLATERLVLRPHEVGDFDALFNLWIDPVVIKHTTGKPASREETWTRLLRYIGHWEALRFGYWAVTARDDGRYVGAIGFADYQRDIDPPLGSVPEAGWGLMPAEHGKGLATEAVQRIHQWAEEETNWTRTMCLLDPDNAASLRIAAKFGYLPSYEARYKGDPTLVMAREIAR